MLNCFTWIRRSLLLPVWIRISPALGSIWGWRTTAGEKSILKKIIYLKLGSIFAENSRNQNLELTEELGQVVLDYKAQDCMVPLELQALEAQEAHEGLGHHEAHGVQVVLKDLLDPAKKQDNTHIKITKSLVQIIQRPFYPLTVIK